MGGGGLKPLLPPVPMPMQSIHTIRNGQGAALPLSLIHHNKQQRNICEAMGGLIQPGINGEVGIRGWMMGDCCIGEVEEYKYLGITIEGDSMVVLRAWEIE